MQKIKNNSLLLFSLLLSVVIVFSFVSSVAAKNTSAQRDPINEENTNKQDGQLNAAEHRSAVANFVQALLKTATSTEGGIGQQVRIIAHEQNDASTTTEEALKKIQTRNRIKTFLFGTDYKNLGTLRSEMVQTRNRLEKLNKVMGETGSTTEIQTQIKTLEQTQTKIEDFVKTQESKFSLFGWLVKLFKK